MKVDDFKHILHGDDNRLNYVTEHDIIGLTDAETLIEVQLEVAKKAYDGMNIVEVGCFLGQSSCFLGSEIIKRNKKVNFSCVDKWVPENNLVGYEHLRHPSGDGFYNQFLKHIELVGMKDFTTVYRMDSIEASKKFDDNSLDFLFLDGSHCSSYVYDELDAWLPKMKKDSLLAGHDYKSADCIIEAITQRCPDHKTTSNRASYVVTFGDGIVDN